VGSSEGAGQLLLYHFMFGRTRRRAATAAPCSSTRWATSPTARRYTSFALVSRARSRSSRPNRSAWLVRPRGTRRRDRLQPRLRCVGAGDAPGGVYQDGESFASRLPVRDGQDIYRTYFTTRAAPRHSQASATFLDLTPLGRQEEWEDSPEGYPQTSRTSGGPPTTIEGKSAD